MSATQTGYQPVGPGKLAWASLLACGLMASLPFLVPVHYYPIPTFRAEFAAVCLGLIALALFALSRTWERVRLPLVAILPLGIGLLLLIQFFSGRVASPQLAVIALGYLAWAACMASLGASLAGTFGMQRFCRALAVSVLGAGAIAAALFIAEAGRAHGADAGSGARLMGSLGQPNHSASLFAMGLASALYLGVRGALPGVAAALSAVMMLAALTLTGSRGAWLYFGGFALLGGVIAARDPGREGRRVALMALLLLPAFWLMQFGVRELLPVATAQAERLFDTVSGVDLRLRLWREAWIMFLEAPVGGIGYGTFPWRHYLLAAAVPWAVSDGIYGNAHNLVLQVLAEFGLPGALLVVALLGLWAAGALARLRDLEHWWLLAMLTVALMHSMLEYPLWYAYFLGIASLLLGATDIRSAPLPPPGAARLARAGVLAGALLGTAGAVALLRSYDDLAEVFRRLDSRAQGGSPVEAARLRDRLFEVHEQSLLAPYVEARLLGLLPLDRERLEKKLVLNAQIMRLFPSHVATYRQAVLLAFKGEPDGAIRQLNHAVAAHPWYLPTFLPVLRELARDDPALEPLLAAAEAKSDRR